LDENGKDVTIEIRKPETVVTLIFLGIVLVMELQVSLSTPISFGDEGFHTRMAQWIAQKVEYPVWIPFTQTDVWKPGFDRPPFWNMLEAGFFWLFGFHEEIVKVLTPMVALFTGIAVYLIAKRFYNERVGLVAAAALATMSSFVTYAILFYTDALMAFFAVMFMFTLSLAVTTEKKLYALAAGAFGGLIFMTKLTGYAAYVLAAMVLFYYLLKDRKPLALLKKYWPMIALMLLMPAAFFVRTYRYYGTPVCYGIPFASFVTDSLFDLSGCSIDTSQPQYSYGGRTELTGTEASVFAIGLMSYLDFAYGNVMLLMFAFFAGLVIVINGLRPSPESPGVFGISVHGNSILDFSLLAMLLIYAALFLTITKRAEDTSRFSLIWAPVIALVAARYLDEVYLFLRKYQKYVALSVFAFVIIYGIFGLRFLDFNNDGLFLNQNIRGYGVLDKLFGYTVVRNGQEVKDYGLFGVKQFSPAFFEACDWIKANTAESATLSTVWSYRAAYSCQRNSVGSEPDMALSNNVTQILQTAKQTGITHIFVQKFSLSDQSLSERYPITYVRLLEANPEHFKKVYENGQALEECIQQGGCDGNILYEIVY
jgi:4-amino-4-deoxy-L-arabinose transferase-like glycosyltransferase